MRRKDAGRGPERTPPGLEREPAGGRADLHDFAELRGWRFDESRLLETFAAVRKEPGGNSGGSKPDGDRGGGKGAKGGEDSSAATEGDDVITGGRGKDLLHGLAGDDQIYGGRGGDTLYGDDGADRLDGGVGDDALHGGAGDDVLVAGDGDAYYGDAGFDRILGGAGDDLIAFSSFGAANGVERIELGGGVNRILGDAAANRLDFSLTALSGVAEIDAGAGADRVTGSSGADVFRAGAGDDVFDGGLGEDLLVLTGRRADYQVATLAQSLEIADRNTADGDEGTDTIVGVERFRFSDGEFTLDELLTVTPPPPPPPPPEEETTPYYVDALQTGSSWGAGPLTLGYTFLTAVPDYYSSSAQERNGFSSFNETQKAAAEYALDQISAICNVSFVEGSLADAKIAFGNAVLSPSYGAYAYYPSSHPIGGDVWINSYYSQNLSPAPGNYGGMTLLHEIGHAMGLKHPFDSSLGPTLPDGEDTRQFTVMSYDAHAATAGEPRSMMLYDIAALQDLYGANTSWRSGDDVYALSGKSNYIATVWDGGGRDVFDAALETSRVILDLRDGHFSSVGDSGSGLARDNVGIAFGARIEDALGGSGADTLIGNDWANLLDGGLGDDLLTGGAGGDLFAFDGAWGRDVVADFQDGLDRLQLQGRSFESLTIEQTAEGALVGDGLNWVQLAGVSTGLLNQDDFLFA